MDPLQRSRGNIPDEFLRGCGFSPWQIEFSKLHNPDLDAATIVERLSTKIFEATSKGPLYIGGIFIFYSHVDSDFADKIRHQLYDAGASVWLDRHDALAGDLQKQVGRAIRINDVVLLVLSKSSVESDWVEHELEMARKKEKEEGRDVLCPVALDDSWKSTATNLRIASTFPADCNSHPSSVVAAPASTYEVTPQFSQRGIETFLDRSAESPQKGQRCWSLCGLVMDKGNIGRSIRRGQESSYTVACLPFPVA